MDQYFMDLYRTRLYLPLVFLILAYVVSPQFRRIFTKAGRWIDGRKTWQAAAGCAAVSFLLCIGVIYSGKSWGGPTARPSSLRRVRRRAWAGPIRS